MNQSKNPSFAAAYVGPHSTVSFKNSLQFRDTKEVPFTSCKEGIITIASVIYMIKNFYLRTALDDKIILLREFGFTQLWNERMIDEKYLIEIQQQNKLRVPKALSWQHLSGVFYVWIVCCFIAFVTFLIEITVNRF